MIDGQTLVKTEKNCFHEQWEITGRLSASQEKVSPLHHALHKHHLILIIWESQSLNMPLCVCVCLMQDHFCHCRLYHCNVSRIYDLIQRLLSFRTSTQSDANFMLYSLLTPLKTKFAAKF